MAKRVKITMASGTQATGRRSYKIGVPTEIGEALYSHGLSFEADLTDEGILFRPVSERTTITDLPAWAKNENVDV
jgi:hypothetical protein